MMLGFKKITKPTPQIIVTEKGITLLHPESEISNNINNESSKKKIQLSQYEKIANSLGIQIDSKASVDILGLELLEFFTKEKIKIYNFHSVCKWLNKKAGRRQTWHWIPLREKEVHFCMLDNTPDHPLAYFPLHFRRWEKPQQYSKIIPFCVLEKIKLINTAFPENVLFFVSEIETNPDPFILVMPEIDKSADLKIKNIYIFDQWDEPGFGEFVKERKPKRR